MAGRRPAATVVSPPDGGEDTQENRGTSMNRISESTSLRSFSRLGRLLAPLGLAVAVATMSAAPAFAAGNNAPNLTSNGYDASVASYVACNASNGTMTVSVTATTLQSIGWLGQTTGPFDGGQWIRYNVWAICTVDWRTRSAAETSAALSLCHADLRSGT
jgi:hypothetical protein